MLIDKDAGEVALTLQDTVDGWYTATLGGPRGRTGEQLAEVLRTAFGPAARIASFSGVQEACRAARKGSVPGDRILVFGSFYTVAQALMANDWLGDPSPQLRS
jgi:dihydrofolate synthase/folylpolyglutamate synthase